MIKEIKYNGFTEQPSDYECPDGDLASLVGLVPEDGAVRPVLPPQHMFTLPAGHHVVFIHHVTPQRENPIVINDTDDNFWWRDDSLSTPYKLRAVSVEFKVIAVSAVGNTLIVLGEDTISYVLWADGQYKVLGNHLPHVALSFGLQGHPRLFSVSDDSHARFTVSFDAMREEQFFSDFPQTQQNQITEQIMAKVNKFVAEQSIRKGRFCFPFFVRYALRLYDSSLVMHSAPVLMNPCTTNNPIVYWTGAHGSSSQSSLSSAVCDMMLVACDLDYQYLSAISDDFTSWKDIVKSVDVFISKPIYPYDQNGKIKRLYEADDFDSVFVGKLYENGGADSITEDKYLSPVTSGTDEHFGEWTRIYAQWTFAQIYAIYFSSDRSVPWSCFRLPEFSEGKAEESLAETSLFYKLCSIPLDDLVSQSRTVIPIDEDYLQSLASREAMTDDYLSHDSLAASLAYPYNSRLNLSGIKRTLFNGFALPEMLAFCNRRFNFSVLSGIVYITIPSGLSALHDTYIVLVHIKENGEDKTLICNRQYDPSMQDFLSDQITTRNPSTGASTTGLSKENWGCYFFYPNANAYKMTIVHEGVYNTSRLNAIYEIPLLPHDHLNGAYALLSYGLTRASMGTYQGSSDPNTVVVHQPNKLYTSEVDNPFLFKALGITTIGTGTITGISSAAKALSQGQFGQFPLYAFTDEGVWALEVSSTGTFSARQPITRDVCINPDSITQLDSAVLFATNRGIMLISGSTSQCITDAINSPSPFDSATLPSLSTVCGCTTATVPFLQFIKDCRMLYDYTHQRIIVYNPAKTYAYVFSLKSKMWGMVPSAIRHSFNAYPDALAQMADTVNVIEVYNMSHDDTTATTAFQGLLVTRPLKLDAPDLLKTVDTVIQRGYFRKGHVQTVLYASRDLIHWQLVYSSTDHYLRGFRGTPYKFFRIALLCTLDPDESIDGCTVQFTPRLLNQPR